MRRGWGGGTPFGWGLALCAACACSGAARVQPAPAVFPTVCALIEAPSTAPDTAMITFDALGVTPEECALTLAAEMLRPWPLGSSEPWTVHLSVTPTAATVRRLSTEDARNAIDSGSALMATDDLDLTDYAAARGELEVTPLSWDRTYLRLSAHADWPLGEGAGPDAVRVDARMAETPSCEPLPTTAQLDSASSTRVVYDHSDRTARALAERIVAIIERPDATATGLAAADLDMALRAGKELAYVVSVPRSSYCDSLVALAHHAPWMSVRSILPLIDTRAHAIAPRAPRP